MSSAAGRELISEVQDAVARVSPEVLARRLGDALNVDFGEILKACTVRIVCLLPESDRLLGTRGLRGFLAAKPDIETVRIAGPHFLLQCAPDSSLAARAIRKPHARTPDLNLDKKRICLDWRLGRSAVMVSAPGAHDTTGANQLRR
jgi:hypothetical protein